MVGVRSMSHSTSPPPEEFFVGSHEDLFEPVEELLCDACGKALARERDGEGYRVAGSGVYLRRRGDGMHFDKVPLCASCASAIGMTALARWEIEEEEG
jgi:hypothetical protein